MNRKFNFISMNDSSAFQKVENPRIEYIYSENIESVNRNSFVEIIGNSENSVICTLAKFVEIIDNQGLEGLAVL